MPEHPVNKPLTPHESVAHVFHDVDKLMLRGACEHCALRIVCHDYGLSYARVLVLYLDRDLHPTTDKDHQ